MNISSYTVLLSYLATFTGIISVSFTLYTMFKSRQKQKEVLEEVRKKEFNNVINSNDIKVVGDYLYKVIGKFSVYDYIDNPNVSQTVDTYIRKLTLYVGKEKDIQLSEGKDITFEKVEFKSTIKKWNEIMLLLEAGQIWNALATLRAVIENSLRKFAKENNIDVDLKVSAAALLRTLHNKGLISEEAFATLKHIIDICNKAVHGRDVEIEVAENTVAAAIKVLEDIDKNIR
ncbi:hypothetical protein P4310_11475 [Bacillus thuringiensis]|uniref:hypothetical protein n=1 Tax=Bacillus cereus group TaxID=86661 RepID=UPI000A369EA9|nr:MULTISPECIES: hypothetical protein [Bacillus cereus group]MED3066165.1 hypothetical protein [Bacillus thuringiensis]OUB30363.1 hypothetical protein BK737_18570 [Bacillus thuringiensis serovar palmanyolensis]